MLKLMFIMLMSAMLPWNWLQTIIPFSFFLHLLYSYNEYPLFNLNYMLFNDHYSSPLIILSMWIIMLSLWSSMDILFNSFFKKEFVLMMILTLTILLLVFSFSDLLSFYISFEMALIPLFMLIIGWGGTPERSEASTYMLFYTISASLPFMGSIFWLYMMDNSLSMMFLQNHNMSIILYLSMLMSFTVKLPLFFLHLWLPKAHVEAPLAGSMILAGVLLKLGGYGIIRILPVLMKLNKCLSWTWTSLATMGGISTCLICLRQTDLKMLIAYSSIVHMSFMLAGLMTMSKTGLSGSVMMMIAHGFSSSSLFCIANITYSQTYTRSILFNKGLMIILPGLTTWWFLLSSSSMGSPPSLNLLSEILLMMALIPWSKIIMFILFMLLMLECTYTIYMYYFSQHGKTSLFINKTTQISTKEYMSLSLHWIPLNMIILNPLMLL